MDPIVPEVSTFFPLTIWVPIHLGILFILICVVWSVGRMILRHWSLTVAAYGARAAFQKIGQMTRIRYRQPWRTIMCCAPGPMSVALVVFAISATASVRESNAVIAAIYVTIFVILAVLLLLELIRPPSTLLLATSDYQQFRILKELQKGRGGSAMSLINQASWDVLCNYQMHYAQRTEEIRQDARGADAVTLAMLQAVPRNPRGPRFDCLRTRNDNWQRTVHDLIEMVPVIVVDTRYVSAPVLREIAWMLDPRRSFKGLFLTEDDGRRPALDMVLGETHTARQFQLHLVTERELYPIVKALTASLASLPVATIPDYDERTCEACLLRQRVEMMINQLQELVSLVGASTVADATLDERIHAWRMEELRDADLPPPAYSTSVDGALRLIRDRLIRDGRPIPLIRLTIDSDESASCEISVRDPRNNWHVYASTAADRLPAPRAALQAFFRMLLGEKVRVEPGDVSLEGDDERTSL